jgi:hypothetical protein
VDNTGDIHFQTERKNKLRKEVGKGQFRNDARLASKKAPNGKKIIV